MTAHLSLMPKPRLVDIIGRSQQETRQAKAAAAYWQRRYADAIAGRYRHELTPAEALAVAAEILDTIGPDPKAAQHRVDLERALYPRCEKPGCGRVLVKGRCTKHQWKQIRSEKEPA